MSDFMQGVKFVKYNCTVEYSTGPFSCLQGYFVLDRQVGYYILWAFLPAGMVTQICGSNHCLKNKLSHHNKPCAFLFLGWASGSS